MTCDYLAGPLPSSLSTLWIHKADRLITEVPLTFAPWLCDLVHGIFPGGALHIFRVRGRAIGKGIYLPDIGIKNGINFHNFGIRNGTYFQDFYMKYIRSDILFEKLV